MRPKEEIMADLEYQRVKLTNEGKSLRSQMLNTAGRQISDTAKIELMRKISDNIDALKKINSRMNAYREPTS